MIIVNHLINNSSSDPGENPGPGIAPPSVDKTDNAFDDFARVIHVEKDAFHDPFERKDMRSDLLQRDDTGLDRLDRRRIMVAVAENRLESSLSGGHGADIHTDDGIGGHADNDHDTVARNNLRGLQRSTRTPGRIENDVAAPRFHQRRDDILLIAADHSLGTQRQRRIQSLLYDIDNSDVAHANGFQHQHRDQADTARTEDDRTLPQPGTGFLDGVEPDGKLTFDGSLKHIFAGCETNSQNTPSLSCGIAMNDMFEQRL